MKEMTDSDVMQRMRTAQSLLVYFSTPACAVCKVLRPKVEELLGAYPDVDFLYIDTVQYPAAAAQHLVFTVPTLLLLGKGRELRRFGRTLSMDDLRGTLDALRAGEETQPSV
jgi:thioredoxin 1